MTNEAVFVVALIGVAAAHSGASIISKATTRSFIFPIVMSYFRFSKASDSLDRPECRDRAYRVRRRI